MAMGYKVSGFSSKKWPQYKVEIDRFAAIVKESGARSYLEIGCLYGDTVHFVGEHLPKGSRIVALDWPQHPRRLEKHPGGTEYLEASVEDLRRNFGHEGHVIFGNSQSPDIIRQVSALGPFDVVFIDGDHSDEGVRLDWENYGKGARMLVGIHDVGGDKRPEVAAFWRKLRKQKGAEGYAYETISVSDKGAGIGVLWQTK
jgi:hypothetical protein